MLLKGLDLYQQALLESQRALEESQYGFASNGAGFQRLLQPLSSRSLMGGARAGRGEAVAASPRNGISRRSAASAGFMDSSSRAFAERR